MVSALGYSATHKKMLHCAELLNTNGETIPLNGDRQCVSMAAICGDRQYMGVVSCRGIR
jgi:hypothetical protein